LLVLCACSHTPRYTQCKQIAKAANPLLDQVETLSAEAEPQAATYRRLAELYRELDGNLGQVESELGGDLKGSLSATRALFRTAARECDRYHDGLAVLQDPAKGGDSKRALKSLADARERMKKTHKSYTTQVNRLSSLCAPAG
jgi:hypothetical protein